MKSTLLSVIPLVSTTTAWTFTWRDASGQATTESGSGPSSCIVVDHAQGELFELDGQGEENINMLLFTNDECSGDPAGQATEDFTREASVDLLGFQVVEFGAADEDTTSGTATATETETDEGTFTLPTVTETSTETETATDDDDGTVTLPTVTETSTSTGTDDEDDETFTLPTVTETTSTETETEVTETETSSVTDTSSTDPPATATDSEEPDATPTDAASSLVLTRTGLVGVAMCFVAGGWALDFLF
ncbi:hypothetical protein BJY04DRAFT_198981 [Aspergillus karnatakaensis]|uniref:uncharacterized protein n=1 Tax=Aspergillus karnatakaensis TaxID=1810916 RepID=UPI003CCCD858